MAFNNIPYVMVLNNITPSENTIRSHSRSQMETIKMQTFRDTEQYFNNVQTLRLRPAEKFSNVKLDFLLPTLFEFT